MLVESCQPISRHTPLIAEKVDQLMPVKSINENICRI